MPIDLAQPEFFDPGATERELRRQFEVCHGCRLCFNLCPAFPRLFDLIDARDGRLGEVTRAQLDEVTDLCYQCKLCFVRCPYIPPHEFALDIPALLLRDKAARAHQQGVTRQDRLLGDPDFVGNLGAWTAPLANWANKNRLNRLLMEKAVGIHRGRLLPRYHWETFARWWGRHRHKQVGRAPNEPPRRRVAFFYTCSVNYNNPEIGKAAVAVLEHNGIEIIVPKQCCCGMPQLDGGNIEAAKEQAKENLAALAPLAAQGYDIVVPGPTCSFVLRHEYPGLLGSTAARDVAARTYDLGEYLIKLAKEGQLATDFSVSPGKLAYHAPCHLKAQRIGLKSLELLRQLPGAEVVFIDKGCSGMDGTWGMKREYFALSQKVAGGLLRGVQDAQPATAVTECPLAALQITQGTGLAVLHPIEVLRRAYGLPEP